MAKKILNESHSDYPEFWRKLNELGDKQFEERQKTHGERAYGDLARIHRKQIKALMAEYDRCYIWVEDDEAQ